MINDLLIQLVSKIVTMRFIMYINLSLIIVQLIIKYP